MTRGEVWLVALDPVVGSEIQKTRPCLIVSPDELNQHLRTAAIVPLTSGSRPARFRVQVQFEGRPGFLLLEQLRTADRRRMVKRLGRVDPQILATTLKLLREMFAE